MGFSGRGLSYKKRKSLRSSMPHQKSKEGYLSVTEVLGLTIDKPFLAFWRGKIGNELASQIQRESQELGIEVHRLIEERFRNGEASPGIPRAVQMEVNFWEKFVGPWEAKPLKLEESFEDKKLKLQGTLDAILETNKGKFVVDFKTSNSLDKISVPLQLSMYNYLADGPGQGLAVRLDKKVDKVEIKVYPDLPQYEKIWKSAIKLARWIKFGEV